MASPLSFHCVICFDKFNKKEQRPVVLPCGHTYVCAMCAERLDKCMECRATLWAEEKAIARATNTAAAAGSRHLRTASTQRNGSKPERKRLPTPTNLVLLSILDSILALDTKDSSSAIMNECGDIDFADQEELEDFDEEEEGKIKLGTAISAGDGGTYAVIAQDGLQILPSTVYSTDNSEEASPTVKAVEDSLQRHESPCSIGSGTRIKKGDRIQVVSISDGWARIGRGYGCIRAGPSSLVKVGVFQDKACSTEAMLRALSKKQESLEREEDNLNKSLSNLIENLEESLRNDEDNAVIPGYAEAPPLPALVDDDEERTISKTSPELRPRYSGIEVVPRIRNTISRSSTMEYEPGYYGCFSGTTELVGCPMDTSLSLGEKNPADSPTSAIVGVRIDSRDSQGSGMSRITESREPALSFRQTDQAPVTPCLSECLRERSRSHEVDFRTGMSGHKGLSSSRACTHRFTERRNCTRFLMSSHSALTPTRKTSTSAAA